MKNGVLIFYEDGSSVPSPTRKPQIRSSRAPELQESAMAPVLLSVLLLAAVGGTRGDTCPPRTRAIVRYTVSGFTRNQTGNTVLEAEMRGNVPLEGGKGLSVEHWSEQCGDRQVVALNVSLTAAPNSILENRSVVIVFPEMIQGVHKHPRRLDYCLLLPSVGAYKVHQLARTWEQARRACEEEDSHLALIETKEELDLLADMLRRVGSSWRHITVWLGLHRQDASDSWRTVQGRALGRHGFLQWGSGWPSDDGNCGALRVYQAQKKIRYLSDPQCSTQLFFLCEQDL